jgi:plasmid maintenance system antidote protein VapI
MSGINSRDAFGGIPAAALKSQQELAGELGTQQQVVSAMKSGQRGVSAEIARRIATKSGEKAGTVYLTSQVASLKHKLATKTISPDGVLNSATQIMRTITKGLRDEELDRRDPAFLAAAEQLKKIAEAALDMSQGEYVEPTYATGDSLTPALKSRDAHGKAVKGAPAIERDGYGKAVR